MERGRKWRQKREGDTERGRGERAVGGGGGGKGEKTKARLHILDDVGDEAATF